MAKVRCRKPLLEDRFAQSRRQVKCLDFESVETLFIGVTYKVFLVTLDGDLYNVYHMGFYYHPEKENSPA